MPASPSSSHHHQRFGTLIGVFTFPTSFPASFPGSDAVSCLQAAPARATTGFCSASLRAALAGGSLLALRRRALDSLRAHPAFIPSSRLSAPAATPCVGDRQCHYPSLRIRVSQPIVRSLSPSEPRRASPLKAGSTRDRVQLRFPFLCLPITRFFPARARRRPRCWCRAQGRQGRRRRRRWQQLHFSNVPMMTLGRALRV